MKNNDLFQNKYRISSTRLQGYDYTTPWSYFITICTKNRTPFFWFIKNGIMCLSLAWSICRQIIEKTKDIRSNTLIDTFVVMPDHVHMIIDILDLGWGDACNASRQQQSSLQQYNQQESSQQQTPYNQQQFWPQSWNIAAMVRGIKWSVTSQIKTFNSWFARQPLYHDHIIRDDAAKQRIIRYIQNNPMNRKK
jgi:putative transposase